MDEQQARPKWRVAQEFGELERLEWGCLVMIAYLYSVTHVNQEGTMACKFKKGDRVKASSKAANWEVFQRGPRRCY